MAALDTWTLDRTSKLYPWSRISESREWSCVFEGPTSVHSIRVSVLGTAEERKHPERLIRRDSMQRRLVTIAMYPLPETLVMAERPYWKSYSPSITRSVRSVMWIMEYPVPSSIMEQVRICTSTSSDSISMGRRLWHGFSSRFADLSRRILQQCIGAASRSEDKKMTGSR